MPVINTPTSRRFPWYVRLFFRNQRRRYGAVLEPARLWGRSPWVFMGVATLYGALDRRSSPIELTAIIAFQNLSSKFNAALGVEPQGFCAAAPQPAERGAQQGGPP